MKTDRYLLDGKNVVAETFFLDTTQKNQALWDKQ